MPPPLVASHSQHEIPGVKACGEWVLHNAGILPGLEKAIVELQIVFVLVVIATMLSCGDARRRELRASRSDSLIFSAGAVKNYARMIKLTDSLEMEGDLSPLDANRWRGVYYYRQGQYRMAEVCYRKALDCEVKTNQDQLSYNKSARRLSELLLIKGDFEGSLRVAMPAVKKMEQSGIGSDIDFAILLNNIGCCQLNLGQVAEANKSFLIAREHYANRWQSDSTGRGFQEAVIGTVYTSMAYIRDASKLCGLWHCRA